MAAPGKILDTYFKISERGSTISTEIRGGVVTFVAMAYIVVLNPLILGSFSADDAAAKTDVLGNILPVNQVAAVTALVAGLMSIVFGVVANYPFAIAAGLGINSLLAVTIAPQVTWPEAMGLVVIDGVIIVLLALTGFRTAVFNAIPSALKSAIAAGIGMFIASSDWSTPDSSAVSPMPPVRRFPSDSESTARSLRGRPWCSSSVCCSWVFWSCARFVVDC